MIVTLSILASLFTINTMALVLSYGSTDVNENQYRGGVFMEIVLLIVLAIALAERYRLNVC